jgi:ubiquinone/menaquinone biosynthesis C-methylase UbiE
MGNLTDLAIPLSPPALAYQSAIMSASEDSWNLHWQHQQNAAALTSEHLLQTRLGTHWSDLFSQCLKSNRPQRFLDIACGSGVVASTAAEVAARQQFHDLMLCGLDVSFNGLKQLSNRVPDATPCLGDSAKLPFATSSFDVVCSQFGVEYGGWLAMHEAARVVKPGGTIALVAHRQDSALQLECESNLEAVTRISETGIFPAVRTLFRWAGPRAHFARGDSAFLAAEAQLGSAVKVLEDLFRQKGQLIAGGNLWKLYSDLAHMYPRLAQYDPADVEPWVDQLQREVSAFEQRMRMMISAALSIERWGQFITNLQANDFQIVRNQVMQSDDLRPVAWTLEASRKSHTSA